MLLACIKRSSEPSSHQRAQGAGRVAGPFASPRLAWQCFLPSPEPKIEAMKYPSVLGGQILKMVNISYVEDPKVVDGGYSSTFGPQKSRIEDCPWPHLALPSLATTPNLPIKIIPAQIRWLNTFVKFPIDMPLKNNILLESNPLKSRILVPRLAVMHLCGVDQLIAAVSFEHHDSRFCQIRTWTSESQPSSFAITSQKYHMVAHTMLL